MKTPTSLLDVPLEPAASAAAAFLQLDAGGLAALLADLRRVELAPGEPLFRQGDAADAMYLLLHGSLRVTAVDEDGAETVLGLVREGEPVGELQLLTGGRRTATVAAAEPSVLLELTAEAFARVAERDPAAAGRIADVARRRTRRNQLRAGLRRLLGELDEAGVREIEARAEWVPLRRGGRLFRQGDAGDGIYVLVGGRLRAVLEPPGGAPRAVGEVAPGEVVGETAFFTGAPRNASVYAIRDSLLAKFGDEEFRALLARHPHLAVSVTRLVLERMGRLYRPPAASAVANVAVVAAGPGVDLAGFAARLAAALAAHGPTLHLTAGRVDERLGTPGLARAPEDGPHTPRLLAWLDEQEAEHRFVLFQADPGATPWTGRCIRQADHVLIVADAAADPAPGEAERAFLAGEPPAAAARRTLVLLHPAGASLPSGTRAWLAPRRLDRHQHLRGQGSAEFARLARFLAGRAVGLVLGGGGARGFAHIGVVRALGEAGVPIDLVGGTSMGAVMAAQCAMGWSLEESLRINRQGWVELGAFREYTLPLFSLLSGRGGVRMGEIFFGDTCAEDLWIDFFCISASLTRAEPRVHRQGLLRRAVGASVAIPGLAPPMLEDGELLVDGGVLNNLPADVMREAGGGVVLAVDVSTETDLTVECAAYPSPWRVLRNRLLRRPVPRVPNIVELLVRTTLLASASRSREALGAADLLLRPPVEGFGLTQMDALEEIAEIGYRYAREQIAAWDGAPAQR